MKLPYNESSRIEELNTEIRRLKQELARVYGSQTATMSEAEEQYRHILEAAKKAEDTLRENEQRLQGIFNNAAIGIVITDSRDRFVDVNNRLCEILGFSRE
ncbi:MAG TPA: PAS domain S-box protein, partial [Bacteroidales bacterium]|nr:PAS domain S-box protein [Bacteroidales bacterium]